MICDPPPSAETGEPTPLSSPSIQELISNHFTEKSLKSEDNNNKIYSLTATCFLSRLDEDADFFTFQTFDDNSSRKSPQLARILHGSFNEHYESLCDLQNQGAGVFVTINETDGKGRTTSNIKRVRALVVDLDGSPLDPLLNAPIEPHMVIQTSQNRYHGYWFIEDCPLERFSKVQKTLASQFGGDPSVCDISRVMRLPGSLHLKQEPFFTKVLCDNPTLPIPFVEFETKFCLNPTANDDHSPKDHILHLLKIRGLVKKEDSYPGCYSIGCPWASTHTTGDDLGTKYYLPGYNGYSSPGFKCFHNHCKEKTIKDLLSFLNEENSAREIWDESIPLPEGLPPVQAFDAMLLPKAIRNWILDIADRMQIPPDFSAAAAMVVASSLIGRRCGIHPKEKDNWEVVPNLWGAVIGRPALLKSPAIAEVMKPLEQLVTKATQYFVEENKQFEVKKLIRDTQEHALKDNLKRAVKKDTNSPEALELIIQQHQSTMNITCDPIQRRYKTEDGTVEKIGEILQQNPNGILIHRDELIGLLKSLDRYGHEGDRAFYLESWNGTGSFAVDRIGRGTLHIPALCLSILGGIQPGPLATYVYQATSGGSGDDGLLQRFQMTVWPDPPTSWINVDRWPDPDAKNHAFKAFEKLSQLSLPIVDDTEFPMLRFDPKGQIVFNNWRNDLESKLRSGSIIPCLESHLAKYRSLMPSIALILYLLDAVDSGNNIDSVTEECALRAVGWCNYLESHAYRLYSSAQSPVTESAKELLKHIRLGNVKDEFSPRDLYRKQWSKLTTPEETGNAIQMLLEYGWIKCKQHKPLAYSIHPNIRKNS